MNRNSFIEGEYDHRLAGEVAISSVTRVDGTLRYLASIETSPGEFVDLAEWVLSRTEDARRVEIVLRVFNR